MLHVFVDADACPVKDEVYRVAARHGLAVTVVANSRLRVPAGSGVELLVVGDSWDAADTAIAERVTIDDIVITADIPLAARCLAKGARVLDPRGRLFTESSIGDALTSRDIASHLRDLGVMTGGPSAYTPRDRSAFLQRFEEVVRAVQLGKGRRQAE